MSMQVRRRRTVVLGGLVALVLVAGCQSPPEGPLGTQPTPAAPVTSQPEQATPAPTTASASATAANSKPEATSTRSATPTEEPKPTESQSVDALPRLYEVECGGNVGGDWEYETFDSLEAAWDYQGPIPLTSCNAKIEWDAEQPDNEKAVADTLGLDDSGIRDAYGLCGAKDSFYTMDIRPMEKEEYAERTVREMRAMLALCPDFPRAEKVRSNLIEAELAIGQRETGDRLGDGTYVVGKDIKPGAWVVQKSKENCYWEVLDNSGGTIDNDFVMASTRLVVELSPSHYAFHTQGCGEWVHEN